MVRLLVRALSKSKDCCPWWRGYPRWRLELACPNLAGVDDVKYKLERIGPACVLIWATVFIEPAGAIGSISEARSSFVLLMSAHKYRHCHNTPRRVYCHKSEPLPVTVQEKAPIFESVVPAPHSPIKCHYEGYWPMGS